jgi:hypothetical protein
MSILQTLINGEAYSFSSIKLTSTVLGAPPLLERVRAVNYKHSLTPGELRGMSPKVLGTTKGEYAADGSLELYLEDWKLFRTGLFAMPTLPLVAGFMQKKFMVTVAYASEGCVPTIDVLRGCRIIEVSKAYSRGTDALFVQLSLHIMEVVEDGVPAVLHPGSPL